MIRLTEIFGGCTLRRCAVAVAVAAAVLMGCSKEDTSSGGSVGGEVLVRLPGVSLVSPVSVVPGARGSSAGSSVTRGSDGKIASEDAASASEGLFSVTLGAAPAADAGTDRGSAEASSGGSGVSPDANGAALPDAASAAPVTRADVALSNVWVFQFNAAGKTMRCEKVDALAVGRSLEVTLNSGWGFTIGVVANGPADGLSVSNVPDLATFREGLLFTAPVTSFDAVPYAGTLDGVSVFTDGQVEVQVNGSAVNLPYIQLRRILAQVTVELTHDVDSYVLDGVELYSVPVGSAFAADRAATAFPSGTDANFGYRDPAASGLAPHGKSGGSYTWYVGQNRRGSGTGITKVQDKNASKAPAYATYARVKTHHATVANAPLYYDIYLGEDMFTDFNVTANHVYVYDTRIVGTAEEHYSLLDTDGRVSGSKPWAVTTSSVTPAGAIRPQGGTYNVTLSGLLPPEGVEVRATITGETPVTGKVTASGKSVSLTLPPNASNNTLDVQFEYKLGDAWVAIENKRSQGGYYVNSAKVTPAGDIPAAGGEYTMTLQCWGWFHVRAVSGGTELVRTATQTVDPNNETKIEKLTVPANTSGDARNVTFQYSLRGEWKDVETRKQASYAVTKATHNAPGNIPGQGATYSVTLEGILPAGGVTVHAATGSTVLAEGKVTTSGQAVQLKVPANYSYSGREIKFIYNWNGAWPVIGTECTQQGWHVDKVYHNAPSTIPAAGGTYTVSFEGWGDYQVRAMSGDTQVAINTTMNDDPTKTVCTHTIAVPANTGNSRPIQFQYRFNGTWTDITPAVDQAAGEINTGGGGTVIEPDPGQKMTWQNAINYCKSKGDGWRLPTQNELMYYWCVEPSIPADSKFSADGYWSATEYSNYSSNAWYVRFGDGFTYTNSKTSSYSVRCVRDE